MTKIYTVYIIHIQTKCTCTYSYYIYKVPNFKKSVYIKNIYTHLYTQRPKRKMYVHMFVYTQKSKNKNKTKKQIKMIVHASVHICFIFVNHLVFYYVFESM